MGPAATRGRAPREPSSLSSPADDARVVHTDFGELGVGWVAPLPAAAAAAPAIHPPARPPPPCADLDLDFERHVICGRVEHTVEVQRAGLAELHLDTSGGLGVSGVEVNRAPAPHALAAPHKTLGRRLTIALPPGLAAGAQVRVGMDVETSADVSAIQW